MHTNYFDKDFGMVDTIKWKFTEIPTEDIPPPRLGHFSFFYNNKFLTFGGFIPKVGYTMDVYSINLDSKNLIWEKINMLSPRNSSPIARSSHSMSIFENYAIMVGG